jgi:hypothetical protein
VLRRENSMRVNGTVKRRLARERKIAAKTLAGWKRVVKMRPGRRQKSRRPKGSVSSLLSLYHVPMPHKISDIVLNITYKW